jgi:hypothetical protein
MISLSRGLECRQMPTPIWHSTRTTSVAGLSFILNCGEASDCTNCKERYPNIAWQEGLDMSECVHMHYAEICCGDE